MRFSQKKLSSHYEKRFREVCSGNTCGEWACVTWGCLFYIWGWLCCWVNWLQHKPLLISYSWLLRGVGGNKQNKQAKGSIADGSKAHILTVTSRKSNLILIRLRKSEVILRSKHWLISHPHTNWYKKSWLHSEIEWLNSTKYYNYLAMCTTLIAP